MNIKVFLFIFEQPLIYKNVHKIKCLWNKNFIKLLWLSQWYFDTDSIFMKSVRFKWRRCIFIVLTLQLTLSRESWKIPWCANSGTSGAWEFTAKRLFSFSATSEFWGGSDIFGLFETCPVMWRYSNDKNDLCKYFATWTNSHIKKKSK